MPLADEEIQLLLQAGVFRGGVTALSDQLHQGVGRKLFLHQSGGIAEAALQSSIIRPAQLVDEHVHDDGGNEETGEDNHAQNYRHALGQRVVGDDALDDVLAILLDEPYHHHYGGD